MQKIRKGLMFVVLAAAVLWPALGVMPAAAEKKSVQTVSGSTVKLNYTLKVDGKVVDSSAGKKPLEFKLGADQVVAGFEKAVKGMKAGEKKSFKVAPEEGYGLVNPKAFQEVPKSKLPADMKPQPGMLVTATDKDGKKMTVKVAQVKKDVVVMDFNHPLAGKTLNFEVEVLEVK